MSQGTSSQTNPHNLYVYDANNGQALGEMLPGPQVGNGMGWLDIVNPNIKSPPTALSKKRAPDFSDAPSSFMQLSTTQ